MTGVVSTRALGPRSQARSQCRYRGNITGGPNNPGAGGPGNTPGAPGNPGNTGKPGSPTIPVAPPRTDM